MRPILPDAATDVVVFVLAFFLSTGACANRVVTCGGQAAEVQALAR